MNTTATGSGDMAVLDDENTAPTAYDVIAQWKAEGKTFGGAQTALRKMGSKLAGGPGGGVVKSSATRGQKIRTGQRRQRGINK